MNNHSTSLKVVVALFAIASAFLATVTYLLEKAPSSHADNRGRTQLIEFDAPLTADSILNTITRRCVVCHGCYDAPCQLKMTSADGISRGANKKPIYNATRLKDAQLTRLHTDASTIEDWRHLGFFAVTPSQDTQAENSLLWQLIEQGARHSFSENAPLPKSLNLDINRDLSCPTNDEIDHYIDQNPYGGMPYGMAPLQKNELNALHAWIRAGTPRLEDIRVIPQALSNQIAEWEDFLNGQSRKERLVSRYLFEHLFLAHLYFSDNQSGTFFRLVRSRTPPGKPIDIIATRRPYDDPDTDEFYYRLDLNTETILHKSHITYPIGTKRLGRIRELFFGTDWTVKQLPPYVPEIASNPFVTFSDIPPQARYAFMLDDADYFIRTFIRGPVCRGQVAVNVIEDHFWVMFLAPKADLSITEPRFLPAASASLGLPAAHTDGSALKRYVPAFLDHHRNYIEIRKSLYRQADPQKKGPTIDAIWKGQPQSGPALLTIFRHFDNASVVPGFVGQIPKTAWVIDFPTFERIYYNLVAGFDVYGSVEHQLATRMYMDLLRIESEDLFLAFLPPEQRRAIHDYWYRGGHLKVRTVYHKAPIDIEHRTRVSFSSNNPKKEFLLRVLQNDQSGVSKKDQLNRVHGLRGIASIEYPLMSDLASKSAPWVKFLPDLSLVRIVRDNGKDKVFSLVHNKAHKNIAFLFAENLRREPDRDTITVVEGLLGSYPNFFFVVHESRVSEFVNSLTSIKKESHWRDLINDFGIRRTSSSFWSTADYFQNLTTEHLPRDGGLLDLNRYVDP